MSNLKNESIEALERVLCDLFDVVEEIGRRNAEILAADSGEMTEEKAADILEGLVGYLEDEQGTDYDKALQMAVEALKTVKEHEETFEWCTDCKEYDQEHHCCHRWTKCIRNTLSEWEQENEIVRCMDCIHMHAIGESLDRYYVCDFMGAMHEVNGYCHHGEKKE